MMNFSGTLRLLLWVAVATSILQPTGLQAKGGNALPAKKPAPSYPFTSVPGDPLKARIYTLNNGLTVMLSVNRDQPRIYTYIATRAGSKNDPATHTGLAHYLEHLLFKGTDRYGTQDYAKEKPLLEEIDALYERYNKTTDPAARSAIYHSIDSASGLAAKYAIPNEYDRMIGAIGGVGSNAFTSFEVTAYMNEIPSNQLANWLTIEGERFRNPILRLFHTELEAVYEEKNISLDDDNNRANEEFLSALFPHHQYGTQTTIGTIEHLKNPSLKEIRKFFQSWYVPNNMVVILAGDFDPDQAIQLIDKNFSWMQPKPTPAFTAAQEGPIASPIVRTVIGKDAENLSIGFRFPGALTHDAMLMEMVDLLLAYKGAGLIDLNLKKAQKVLDAGSGVYTLKDYCVHQLSGEPKAGQSLEEVRDLLLQQIEAVKAGNFTQEDLTAILRNVEADQMRQRESNPGRASWMLDAFILGEKWEDRIAKTEQMKKVTRQQIMDFARKNYGNNYVVVYKRQGENADVEKVEKPAITPVDLNRDAVSPFAEKVLSAQPATIQPVFVDYQRDIARTKLPNGAEMLSVANTDNNLFTLTWMFELGRRNSRTFPMAASYIKLIGADTMSAATVARKFFALGCSFNIGVSDDRISISVSGLQENMAPALDLLRTLIEKAQPNQTALQNMVKRELKSRTDAKLDKGTILWGGIYSHAMYDGKNPFNDRLSEADLNALKAEDLVRQIQSLPEYRHTLLYYGPAKKEEVAKAVAQHMPMSKTLKDPPKPFEYDRREMKENIVYVANYPGMVQAELIWTRKAGAFDKSIVPTAELFNQYFGGDMSSVVFQTIRESKALAYSTSAGFQTPSRKEDPNYLFAYVGTQADKMPEAIVGMNELLTTLPESEGAFEVARESMRSKLQTQRVTKMGILYSYLDAQRMGYATDSRRDLYESLDRLNFASIATFHRKQFSGQPYAYCVLGDTSKMDMAALRKLGRVVEVPMQELFGY
ncbi:MAG: insulinase family protein [Chlorobi bacterium]|nr:MAG: processing peptidase [Chlorobi bacterium OLB7]MBK8911339.1 insulinase family protein [Chlorobiota bacterium]MBX7217717.1 insulinase family protein [Candidatus Kapabacteria bacterium]